MNGIFKIPQLSSRMTLFACFLNLSLSLWRDAWHTIEQERMTGIREVLFIKIFKKNCRGRREISIIWSFFCCADAVLSMHFVYTSRSTYIFLCLTWSLVFCRNGYPCFLLSHHWSMFQLGGVKTPWVFP